MFDTTDNELEELAKEEEYWKRYQDACDIEKECNEEDYNGLSDYERNH